MAAKGSIAKQEVAKKILNAFPGSFLYNDGKEIRINWTEDELPLQIKITLTAAKTPVEGGISTTVSNEDAATVDDIPVRTGEKIPEEPSAEEKERLKTLLNQLGL